MAFDFKLLKAFNFDIKWECKVKGGYEEGCKVEGGYEGREIFYTGGPISYSTNPDEISCD